MLMPPVQLITAIMERKNKNLASNILRMENTNTYKSHDPYFWNNTYSKNIKQFTYACYIIIVQFYCMRIASPWFEPLLYYSYYLYLWFHLAFIIWIEFLGLKHAIILFILLFYGSKDFFKNFFVVLKNVRLHGWIVG